MNIKTNIKRRTKIIELNWQDYGILVKGINGRLKTDRQKKLFRTLRGQLTEGHIESFFNKCKSCPFETFPPIKIPNFSKKKKKKV